MGPPPPTVPFPPPLLGTGAGGTVQLTTGPADDGPHARNHSLVSMPTSVQSLSPRPASIYLSHGRVQKERSRYSSRVSARARGHGGDLSRAEILFPVILVSVYVRLSSELLLC